MAHKPGGSSSLGTYSNQLLEALDLESQLPRENGVLARDASPVLSQMVSDTFSTLGSYLLDGDNTRRNRRVERMLFGLLLQDQGLAVEAGRSAAVLPGANPLSPALVRRRVPLGRLFDSGALDGDTLMDASLEEYFLGPNAAEEVDTADFDVVPPSPCAVRTPQLPKRIFQPSQRAPGRSVLRPCLPGALNLVVHALHGDMNDATKYATELNANNLQGIPIPRSQDEVVTIPVHPTRRTVHRAPGRSGPNKAAIVRAYPLCGGAVSETLLAHHLGCYSHTEMVRYMRSGELSSAVRLLLPLSDSEVEDYSRPTAGMHGRTRKRARVVGAKRRVGWASELEW